MKSLIRGEEWLVNRQREKISARFPRAFQDQSRETGAMPLVRHGQLVPGEDPPLGLLFFCPACNERHVVRIAEGGWKWNGNEQSPTIEPSVKCEQPKWDEAKKEYVPDRICHSVVTDGTIRYCKDCTHALVNQVVPMVEF